MIRGFISKKGDLPVTILVIGIFVLCGFALLTFFISDFRTSNSFVGVEVMEKVNSFAEEYLFYKNSGVPQNKLDSFFNIKEEYGRRYFHEEEISGGGIPLFGGDERVVFSISYQVPS